MCSGVHRGAWGLVGKGRRNGWERNYTTLLKTSLTSGNEPGEDQQGRVKMKHRAHIFQGHLGLENVLRSSDRPRTEVSGGTTVRDVIRQKTEKNVLF